MDESGKVCCSLVMGKSHVAPLTIPRMEIVAVTLSLDIKKLDRKTRARKR